MKISFAKKFKTATKLTSKFLVMWFTVFPFINLFALKLGEEDDSTFMVITQCFTYGSFISLLYTVMINSQFFSNIHHLRVMPFTMRDIKDIAFMNIIYHTLITAVIQCGVTAIFLPDIVPYILCMIIVNVALGMSYLLTCFTDKRVLAPPSKAASVEQSRKYVASVIVIMLVIMLVSVALSTFIMYRGIRGTLAENIPMLIIISSAAIVVSLTEAAICRRMKTEII